MGRRSLTPTRPENNEESPPPSPTNHLHYLNYDSISEDINGIDSEHFRYPVYHNYHQSSSQYIWVYLLMILVLWIILHSKANNTDEI